MGVVYRATDTRLGRDAALKFLSAEMQRDARARERFEREARAASALNHPNICTIYGVDEFEGHPYLAMELLRGRTLADLISQKPLEMARTLDLAAPILSALEAAHSEGILHRDLKPANIFLTDKGQVKILDFGLAKQIPLLVSLDEATLAPDTSDAISDLTTPGMILGTVSYMSPEQIRAERLDARSDLFSFGTVLYEMVTGQQAFPGKMPVLVLDAILNRPPAPITQSNPAVHPGLAAIVSKSLEKDRARRYESASAMLNDLRELQQGRQGSSQVSAPVAQPRSGLRRVSWSVASLLVILLVIAAASIYWLKRGALSPSSKGTVESPQTIARPSIAVLGFENLTGRSEHAWLSTAFSEMLSTELAAGGRMRVVSGEDVARARKDLDFDEVRTFSAQTLARIRKNLGVDYVVTGSYLESGQGAGGQLRLDARLQDARSGEIVASLPETGTELKLIELLSQTEPIFERSWVSEISRNPRSQKSRQPSPKIRQLPACIPWVWQSCVSWIRLAPVNRFSKRLDAVSSVSIRSSTRHWPRHGANRATTKSLEERGSSGGEVRRPTPAKANSSGSKADFVSQPMNGTKRLTCIVLCLVFIQTILSMRCGCYRRNVCRATEGRDGHDCGYETPSAAGQ